jgi:hypothetical protein
MPNLLEQAIGADNGELAAKIIQDALSIESDDVANYCFPKTWPADRERRARIIGDADAWCTRLAEFFFQ